MLRLIETRFAKVLLAGACGALAHLAAYGLLLYPLLEQRNLLGLPEQYDVLGMTLHPRFALAQGVAIEIAVVVTFVLNNVWGFAGQKLVGLAFLGGLARKHVVVLGAMMLQLATAQGLAAAFGVGLLRNYVYQVAGIGIGFAWNYHFYKKIIWRVRD